MKSAIVGVGNPFWGDEGLGVYLAQNPQPGLPAEVDVIDGGTAGPNLLRFFDIYDRLIILDAIKHGGKPGDVIAFQVGKGVEMGPRGSPSAHGLDLSFVLLFCEMLDLRAEVIVIGCEPERCAAGQGLSETVKKSIPRVWTEVERYLSGREARTMQEKKRILIVDDDPDIRAAMRLILTSHGYEVATAESGESAFKKIHEAPPDLIILDVMMETLDEGFQATYRLKGDSTLHRIPVLMVTAVSKETGFSFDPARDDSFLPVEGFIEKPVDPEVLLSKVRSLIS